MALVEQERETAFLGSDPVEERCKSLRWDSLDFSIGDKPILSSSWGDIPKGSVTAIMGPSGAGKSSLMNVLAGRISSNSSRSIKGNILVNDTPIDPVAYKSQIAYVMQDDAIMTTSTPREALTFAAALRLPGNPSVKEINAKVESMLLLLGLEKCADNIVGGGLIKGISGGERKRTSVGVELITDPSLIFLDEPTSGLDAYSAFKIVELLRKLAGEGRCTVVCTIHQPSSEVFLLFDQAILLKDGLIVYGGPVRDLSSFFEKAGCPVPDNTNPADHAMFVVQMKSLDDLRGKNLLMAQPSSSSPSSSSLSTSNDQPAQTIVSSFSKQLSWLMGRESKAMIRDKRALIGRFGITIFLNTLFGIIFWGAGSKDDSLPQNFYDHYGALTMVTISSMFGSAQPVLLQFPYHRPVFLREYSSKTYSVVPYVISKMCFEIPLSLAQTTVQWIIVYFMIGFQGDFYLLTLSALSLALTSASVAALIGSFVTDVNTATEFMPLVFVPQMLFAGFFVRTDQIPVYLRWAQYLCSLKYAMNVLTIVEFGVSTCPPENENCSEKMEGNEIEEDMWWVYVLILLSLFIVFRLSGAFLLTVKAKTVF